MIEIAASGRLGVDPKLRETSNGKPMTVGSVGVDAAPHDATTPAVQWMSLVAFGRTAQTLAQHKRGDLVHVIGTASWREWTAEDGKARSRWSINVQHLISARPVWRRPRGGKEARERRQPV